MASQGAFSSLVAHMFASPEFFVFPSMQLAAVKTLWVEDKLAVTGVNSAIPDMNSTYFFDLRCLRCRVTDVLF